MTLTQSLIEFGRRFHVCNCLPLIKMLVVLTTLSSCAAADQSNKVPVYHRPYSSFHHLPQYQQKQPENGNGELKEKVKDAIEQIDNLNETLEAKGNARK